MTGSSQRVYRQRIKSTGALKKMFRAQEMIATSRITSARTRVTEATPFATAITRAVTAVATHAHVDHRMTRQRTDTKRVAVLVIGADRGMAGAYTAALLRETERLLTQLRSQGCEPHLYVAGRRAITYFKYRDIELAREWVYGSDKPTPGVVDEIAATLLDAHQAPVEAGGVAELHVVYTQFVNMVTQKPRVVRLLPLEVTEAVVSPDELEPLYDFEPSAEVVLDALLPRYVRARLYAFVVDAAAAELASRQRAMHTAVDNADDLIRNYTRLANQARQATITNELSEIVSGADALTAAK